MIEEAVAFAVKAHEGAFRKGTKIPYIVHPLETAVIVSMMTEDEEVICAALLHDVIEDTGITKEELSEKFGVRVAELVSSESEDKSKSWEERKQATLDYLKTAPKEDCIIALGDKLSNMRSTARDYILMGDRIWNRFNEQRKNMQEWYYRGIAKSLSGMEDNIFLEEYVRLCDLVFGRC